LRTVGGDGLDRSCRTPRVVGDQTVTMQIGNVLHSATIELRAGRALPLGVRRAVRGLPIALREIMDPRPTDEPKDHDA
jgi:hypothetical protein